MTCDRNPDLWHERSDRMGGCEVFQQWPGHEWNA
jgi:hypothetical protein